MLSLFLSQAAGLSAVIGSIIVFRVNILYLIVAHRYPRQVARLVAKLRGPGVSFLLHVDRRADIAPYRSAIRELAGSADLTFARRRMSAPWGSPGMTEAILHGLEQILETRNVPDYIACISGQDYPIRRPERIREFFASAAGRPLIWCVPLEENPYWTDNQFSRVMRYHYWHPWSRELRVYPPDEPPATVRSRMLHSLLRFVFPFPKPFPPGLKIYTGTSWWALTPDAARFLVEQARSQRRLCFFLKHSYVPEELVFHTLLANSPLWKDRLDPRFVLYQRWSTSKHPDTLTMRDREDIAKAAQTFPLARKFDASVDEAILDWIDQNLLS